jgi:DNA-binding transcriptional regulator YbjK
MTDDAKPVGSVKRRRELCDAAIEILGESGLKGLSHVKVDRRAGVAEGSTSVYFRTRRALVRAVAERLNERSRDGLLALIKSASADDDSASNCTPSALAMQLLTAAKDPFQTQVKARYELFLLASEDDEIAALFQQNLDLEFEFLRQIVAGMQSSEPPLPGSVVDDQTLAVVAMVSGITLSLLASESTFYDPQTIDRFLKGVVTGMRSLHR